MVDVAIVILQRLLTLPRQVLLSPSQLTMNAFEVFFDFFAHVLKTIAEVNVDVKRTFRMGSCKPGNGSELR
ncbi:hypothetical protein D3C78_1725290 [compost metagenome]